MNNLPKLASVYIVVITIAFIVIFYAFLRQRDAMKKNKFKYDLRIIRHELEPLGEDTWRLNFYAGHLVHSEVVREVDIFNDKAYLFKAFIRWLEEDANETKR